MEPLVNVNEAAKLLGLSSWTVRKLIASNRLSAVRINRRVLLQPEELRRIIEEGRGDRKAQNAHNGSSLRRLTIRVLAIRVLAIIVGLVRRPLVRLRSRMSTCPRLRL